MAGNRRSLCWQCNSSMLGGSSKSLVYSAPITQTLPFVFPKVGAKSSADFLEQCVLLGGHLSNGSRI